MLRIEAMALLKTGWFTVAICLALLCACEESLPPRIPPDLSAALEPAFGAFQGAVVYLPGDTTTQSESGSFYIDVKNIHDEFLSGPENIQIEIEMWRERWPSTIYNISGDRNNLQNPYDFQGEAFMLDGDVLSLAPDSTAGFLIAWDHTEFGFYNDANPHVEIDQCGTFPLCGTGIITDPISFGARGAIRLFESESDLQSTGEIRFSISYAFFKNGVTPVQIDSMVSSFDSISNSVSLGWRTFFHVAVARYEVQRAFGSSGNFDHLADIALEGALSDTTSYSFVDPTPFQGINSYRLGVWQFAWPFDDPLLAYYLSFPIVVVP